jgi:hypothetical protein
MTVKVGCVEKKLNVPLFAELYGYGPFLGRRNIGERDPLYCRALSFYDGHRRNLVIATDAVVSDDLDSQILRAQISNELKIDPSGIMFTATHTHSGPAMSLGIGWGERCPEYLDHWRETVLSAAREVIKTEEEVKVFAGRAPLSKKVGLNRVDPVKNETDPDIRWIKFVRKDGSVKTLLHNHAMHGVVYGPKQLRVSADWMGDVNRQIKERKLAEIPFFFLGTAGDINVIWSQPPENRDPNLLEISNFYTDELEKDLNNGQELKLDSIESVLENFEFPTQIMSSEEMRKTAESIKERIPLLYNRLIEMATLSDQGADFRVLKDLQVLRMGDLAFYAFPGEPFLELGQRIMAESPFKFPVAISVANGNGRYFPSKETFNRFPSITMLKDWGEYGFYEIHAGAGRYMPKYKDNIADFITEKSLNLKLK